MSNRSNTVASWLQKLNPMQKEAVLCTEGPVLVLAGAGSGKTRVIACRTANLLESGVKPSEIMAVTFTNKAAAEMKERIQRLVPGDGAKVSVSTFHSACLSILRKHSLKLGFHTRFSVYDEDSQKSLMREILKSVNLPDNNDFVEEYLNKISHAKNRLIFSGTHEADVFFASAPETVEIYRIYQERLLQNQAMDFNDLLMNTIRLFETNADILLKYQERYRYVMVDEYQDTNHAQFVLINLLVKRHNNLCVVGDDDQSIYGWRDADVNNILEFPKRYPGTRIIKLEQNYRSTKNILRAANEVVHHNQNRMDKTLWTDNQDGTALRYRGFMNEREEANFFVNEIFAHRSYSDIAIISRTSSPLNFIGSYLDKRDIPFIMVGGMSLYDRKEIKEILSYLRAVDNPEDVISLKRAMNFPKRGIGEASFAKITTFSMLNGISLSEAFTRVNEIDSLGKKKETIADFMDMILGFRDSMNYSLHTVSSLIDSIISSSGIINEVMRLYKDSPSECEHRLEHIQEFQDRAKGWTDTHDEYDLAAFLGHVSLVTSTDPKDWPSGRVTLMTAHAAKGLEYKDVYICGMEEGHFPHCLAENEGFDEEERRLLYVSITRAMENLTFTSVGKRWKNNYRPSSFLSEIPKELFLAC